MPVERFSTLEIQLSCTPVESRHIDPNTVLVVVPCLNEAPNIAGIIDQILQDRNAKDFLIVVADGGSSDGTRAIVSRIGRSLPNVCLIDNLRQSQSAGVNLAAKSFGDGRRWLVRMDAHADYPANYISNLISEAERTQATSVVVAMTSQGKCCFQRAAAVAQNTFLGAGGSAHRMGKKEGFVDHGHHALFDMNAFRALEGYNETQSHNEDAELDARLERAGGRIWLTRATGLTYYPRSDASALFAQYKNYGRGRATTILRHHAIPKLRQLLPAAVVPSAFGLLLAPLQPAAAAPIALWLVLCLVFSLYLGLRARTRCAFGAGAAAIIMHFAWSAGFWLGLLEFPSIWALHERPKYQ